MKKCLLFIFILGITFSLYNVKVKANDDFSKQIKLSRSIYTLNPDNYDNVYFVEGYSQTWYNGQQSLIICTGQNYQGSFSIGSTNANLSSTFGFSLLNVNIGDFQVNSSYGSQQGSIVMNNIKRIIVYKGSFNFGNYETEYESFESWEAYQESLNPLPDISLCAFFFEPDPNTGLYSMYCFPQELDDNEVVTIYYNNLNNIGFEITSASVDTLKRCYLESGSNIEYYHSIEYWLEMIDQVELENDNVIDFLFTTPIYAVYCDFIENNENPNYNIFPLTEESWWDDIVNSIGFENTELGFIWEWLFGDPDPDYHNVTIDNSPSPTPLPTPIPYRTTLVPDGNGGYEFQYEYEDSNGNTVTASAPPEQPNYDGNALITQPVNMNISGVPVSDVEGVQSLLNVIGEADQDYKEGFQVIGKSFAVLPSKWFIFFGIPAAIILIAGIIKSLLG